MTTWFTQKRKLDFGSMAWAMIRKWPVRYKLFASYSFFILLLLLILGISLSFYNRRRTIANTTQQFTNLMINTLQLLKLEQSFFLTDLRNPYFYQYGRSELLDQHRALYDSIQQTIGELLQEPFLQELDILVHLKHAREQLSIYQDKLRTTIVLVQRMGYRHFGEYGAAQRVAAQLDTMIVVRRVEWLSLRLLEQQVLRSVDLAYLEKMRIGIEALKQSLSKQIPRQYNQIAEQLDAYYNHLRWYAIYHKQVGDERQGEGYRFELRLHADRAVAALERALREIISQDSQLQGSFQNIIIVLFLIMVIVSLTFGYFLSYLMTIPLQHLSKVMRRYTRYIMQEQHERLKQFYAVQKYTDDELGELTESFNQLIFALQEAIESLEKKQAELARINEELEESNKTLEERNHQLHNISLEISLKIEEIEKQRQLIEDELRIKERIYEVISQEIRSPLSTLKGFLILLTNHAEALTAAEQTELMHKMLGELDKAILHLQDILQWMQKSEAAGEHILCFDVVRHLQESIAQSRPFLDAKQIRLEIENTCQQLLSAKIEKEALQFIMRNLLSNAVRMCAVQGVVRIQIMCCHPNRMSVCVQDNGVGMSAAELEAYRHAIRQGAQKHEGKLSPAVLSLLMCHDFVVRNGGAFMVESRESYGTKVCFTFETIDYWR